MATASQQGPAGGDSLWLWPAWHTCNEMVARLRQVVDVVAEDWRICRLRLLYTLHGLVT